MLISSILTLPAVFVLVAIGIMALTVVHPISMRIISRLMRTRITGSNLFLSKFTIFIASSFPWFPMGN